jgi:hypothetical protein
MYFKVGSDQYPSIGAHECDPALRDKLGVAVIREDRSTDPVGTGRAYRLFK